MNFTRQFIDTDATTRVSYLDPGGDGHPVLMLHGFAGSAEEFIQTARALNDRRAPPVDQRGHGHCTRHALDTSRQAFVNDVVRVLEAARVAPTTLIGQSTGARTAMLVAATRPDLVDKLVLLEGGVGSGTEEEHAQLGDFLRCWPTPLADRDAARAFLDGGVLAAAWADDLEQRTDGLHPRFDPDVLVAAIRAVATPHWEEWERVSTPTRVEYAGNGMFSVAERAEFVSRERHVLRVGLSGATPDAHLDSFDAWITVAIDFLTVR